MANTMMSLRDRLMMRNNNKPAGTRVSLSDLESVEVAKTKEVKLPWRMTHGVSRGVSFFKADLANGKSVFITPVMPRDEVTGEALTPAIGQEGTLTISVPEYDRLDFVETVSSTGKISLRPAGDRGHFVNFE